MAKNDISFPKIGESNWWRLRDLFKNRVPVAVTPSYLSTALNMAGRSAKANIIAPFKKIGFIDDNGTPTDIAYDWRDDKKYREVCQNLIKQIYPQEVQDLFNSDSVDTVQLRSWFMNYCRCGMPAAGMFGSFYRLLLRADPTEGKKILEMSSGQARKQKTDSKKEVDEIKGKEAESKPSGEKEGKSGANKINFRPSVNVNIQIHISPDASSEQIDDIFKRMADHLSKMALSDE